MDHNFLALLLQRGLNEFQTFLEPMQQVFLRNIGGPDVFYRIVWVIDDIPWKGHRVYREDVRDSELLKRFNRSGRRCISQKEVLLDFVDAGGIFHVL